MTQSFWEGTSTHPIDNGDETQKVDLLNALHQDLEKDPSFGGRFTKNRTLTRLGQANLIGLLIITAVLLAALFSWASVDFVLDGSSGEGCLSGLVTVFCAVRDTTVRNASVPLTPTSRAAITQANDAGDESVWNVMSYTP